MRAKPALNSSNRAAPSRRVAPLSSFLFALLSLLLLLAPQLEARSVEARRHLRDGDRLFNDRSYHEALARYDRYLETRGAVSGELSREAEIQSRIAECAEKAGRYDRALEFSSRALWLYLELDDRPGVARTLRRMAELKAFSGAYDESLRLIGLSRQVPEGIASATDRAEAFRSIAVSSGALGRYDDQRSAAQAALEEYRRQDDPAGVASSLSVLAAYHRSQGEFATAIELAEEALREARRSPNPDLAPAYLTLASVHRARGDLRDAVRTDSEALDAARKGGVTEAIAVARAALGIDALAFGEVERARKALETAASELERVAAGDDLARVELELGRLAFLEGDSGAARKRLIRARELYTEAGQKTAAAVADDALGKVLLASGEKAGALEAHERAVRVFEEAGEATGHASAETNRGFALTALGRFEAARAAFARAETLTGEARVSWQIEHGRARLASAQGSLEAATAAYERAMEGIEQLYVRSRIPEFRSSFLGGVERMEVYDEAMALALDRDRPDLAFEVAERARARNFLDLVGSSRLDLREGVDRALLDEERELRAQMAQLSQRLERPLPLPQSGAPFRQAPGEPSLPGEAGLGAVGPDSSKPGRSTDRASPDSPIDRRPAADTTLAVSGDPAARDRLGETKRRHAELLERIAASSPQLDSLVSTRHSSAREVQAALEPGDLLLLFHIGPRGSWVFSVTSGSIAAHPLPGDLRRLRALVEVARIHLEERIPNDRIARELHDVLLGSAGPGPSTRRLIVSAHDSLHYLPFQALRDREGRYLIEQVPITYVPSASAMLAIRLGREWSGKLVAFGSPENPLASPIPGTAEELESIAKHYPDRQILTGSAASEEAFVRSAPTAGVLHVACHGILDPELPMYSGLLLSPGGGEDGRLELHEVFGLDLRAGLTVLSACQTALGKLARGDELVCLARSFLHAGSASVIASLWSVSDRPTARFMGELHAALAKRERPGEALRTATLAMLSDPELAEPHVWAAFSAFGGD